MAVDKLVDSTQLDADLTSVANAIRTKGGTSGALSFPNGFISAIQNLGGDGLTNEVKQALLQIGQKVAYIDDQGQQYYNDLMAALYHVNSISAVFTQGSAVIYDTDSLDTLKQYLVVTANYSDGTSATTSDYTLSGTLEEGTSTITVSYSGKTASFDVTVTDSGLPKQYTWLYKAKDGELLSAQSYVSLETGGTGGTETLVDENLVLHANASVSASTTNFLRYLFSDANTTNGKLSCRAKLVDTMVQLGLQGASGFRLQLSNGTSGAQAFFLAENSTLTVIYFEGSTRKTIQTNFSANDYHIFELELKNGHQIFGIDGTQIFDTATLSTNYCTSNAILNQASTSTNNPNGITTNIDWLAYYEVS